MTTCKINSSVFDIAVNSLKILCKNFTKVFKMYLYPFFGQLIGIAICFIPLGIGKALNLPYAPLLLVSLIGLAVGLALFCHAFWRSLLVQGALVEIANKIIGGEEVTNFDYYIETFSRRTKPYIKYLLIMCLVSILLVIPTGAGALFGALMAAGTGLTGQMQIIAMTGFAMLIGFIVLLLTGSIFSASLQSFVLNPGLTPFETVKKCVELVLKNYLTNLGLIVLLALLSMAISFVIELVLGVGLFIFGDKIADAISNIVSGLYSTFFVTPWFLIATTWWYLRMDNKKA